MDVASWFHDAVRALREADQHELANALSSWSHEVTARHDAVVDARYPELLAAAKAAGNEWLELYVRHWYSQSLYLRERSSELLDHALESLALAQQPANQACPQAVCTVQDACMAYASCDGPTYVDHRLQLTADAFARIDPTWECHVCLAAEEANALVDSGRVSEALVTVRRRIEDRTAAVGRLNTHDSTVLARWLAASGDPAGALAMLQPKGTEYPFAAERSITRALAHLALGDPAAAATALPPSADARGDGEYARWIEAHDQLVQAGIRDNTWPEAATLHAYVVGLVRQGASWRAFGLAERAVRLAADRGARASAAAALALMRAAQATLAEPARVAARVAVAETLAAAVPVPVLTCAPQDAADHLAGLDDTDPEHLLDLVDVALAAGADGDDLLVLRARLLADVGRSEEARELLLPRVAAEPLSEFLAAGATRAFWNDDTSLQRVAELLAAHQPILSAWALANLAFRRRDFAETERQCRVILDLDPTAVNTWRLRADAARAMGNHIDELAHRLAVLQHSDPVDPMDRWQLLVPATIWGEWDLVREQLPFLDLHPQSSQGPISEHWGYVTITYPDGGSPDIVAQRTGPVSAIIRGVLAWDDEQQYGDEVVFAPGFLDERPADADDPDTDWRPLFAHVCTVREGRYRSQPVTGPYPGDDAWEAVRSKLGDCDLVRADHLYELFDQQRGHKVPAVWAQLLIPPTITDAQADALLTAATADLEDPLFWWELADEAGGDTRLHAERGKRYGRKYPGV